MVRVVKHAAERRNEIVEVACRLFISKGYDKTTMRDVMRELRIAKGTIYHYFASKEELLDAVIESIVEQDLKIKQDVVASSQGDALSRLKMLITSSARDEGKDDELLENLHQLANAGMHVRLLARIITVQAPLYADLIDQGCAEGVFKTDFPLECAEFILAGVQFITDMGIYPWSEEQLSRRIEAFSSLVEAQLRAPEGTFDFLTELLRKPE